MRILPRSWTVGWDIETSIKAKNFVYACFMLDMPEKYVHAMAGYFLDNPRTATTILNGLNGQKGLGGRFLQFCTFLSDRAHTALAAVPPETFENFAKGANLNAQQKFGELLAAAQKVGIEHKVLPAIKTVLKDELTKLHTAEPWAVKLFAARETSGLPHFPEHIVKGLLENNSDFVLETVKEAVGEAIQEGRWRRPAHFMRSAYEHGIAPGHYLSMEQIQQLEKQWMGKASLGQEDVKTYTDFVGALGDYAPYMLPALSSQRLETAAVYLHTGMRQAFKSNAEMPMQAAASFYLNNFMDAVNGHPDSSVSEMIASTLEDLDNGRHLRN